MASESHGNIQHPPWLRSRTDDQDLPNKTSNSITSSNSTSHTPWPSSQNNSNWMSPFDLSSNFSPSWIQSSIPPKTNNQSQTSRQTDETIKAFHRQPIICDTGVNLDSKCTSPLNNSPTTSNDFTVDEAHANHSPTLHYSEFSCSFSAHDSPALSPLSESTGSYKQDTSRENPERLLSCSSRAGFVPIGHSSSTMSGSSSLAVTPTSESEYLAPTPPTMQSLPSTQEKSSFQSTIKATKAEINCGRTVDVRNIECLNNKNSLSANTAITQHCQTSALPTVTSDLSENELATTTVSSQAQGAPLSISNIDCSSSNNPSNEHIHHNDHNQLTRASANNSPSTHASNDSTSSQIENGKDLSFPPGTLSELSVKNDGNLQTSQSHHELSTQPQHLFTPLPLDFGVTTSLSSSISGTYPHSIPLSQTLSRTAHSTDPWRLSAYLEPIPLSEGAKSSVNRPLPAPLSLSPIKEQVKCSKCNRLESLLDAERKSNVELKQHMDEMKQENVSLESQISLLTKSNFKSLAKGKSSLSKSTNEFSRCENTADVVNTTHDEHDSSTDLSSNNRHLHVTTLVSARRVIQDQQEKLDRQRQTLEAYRVKMSQLEALVSLNRDTNDLHLGNRKNRTRKHRVSDSNFQAAINDEITNKVDVELERKLRRLQSENSRLRRQLNQKQSPFELSSRQVSQQSIKLDEDTKMPFDVKVDRENSNSVLQTEQRFQPSLAISPTNTGKTKENKEKDVPTQLAVEQRVSLFQTKFSNSNIRKSQQLHEQHNNKDKLVKKQNNQNQQQLLSPSFIQAQHNNQEETTKDQHTSCSHDNPINCRPSFQNEASFPSRTFQITSDNQRKQQLTQEQTKAGSEIRNKVNPNPSKLSDSPIMKKSHQESSVKDRRDNTTLHEVCETENESYKDCKGNNSHPSVDDVMAFLEKKHHQNRETRRNEILSTKFDQNSKYSAPQIKNNGSPVIQTIFTNKAISSEDCTGIGAKQPPYSTVGSIPVKSNGANLASGASKMQQQLARRKTTSQIDSKKFGATKGTSKTLQPTIPMTKPPCQLLHQPLHKLRATSRKVKPTNTTASSPAPLLKKFAALARGSQFSPASDKQYTKNPSRAPSKLRQTSSKFKKDKPLLKPTNTNTHQGKHVMSTLPNNANQVLPDRQGVSFGTPEPKRAKKENLCQSSWQQGNRGLKDVMNIPLVDRFSGMFAQGRARTLSALLIPEKKEIQETKSHEDANTSLVSSVSKTKLNQLTVGQILQNPRIITSQKGILSSTLPSVRSTDHSQGTRSGMGIIDGKVPSVSTLEDQNFSTVAAWLSSWKTAVVRLFSDITMDVSKINSDCQSLLQQVTSRYVASCPDGNLENVITSLVHFDPVSDIESEEKMLFGCPSIGDMEIQTDIPSGLLALSLIQSQDQNQNHDHVNDLRSTDVNNNQISGRSELERSIRLCLNVLYSMISYPCGNINVTVSNILIPRRASILYTYLCAALKGKDLFRSFIARLCTHEQGICYTPCYFALLTWKSIAHIKSNVKCILLDCCSFDKNSEPISAWFGNGDILYSCLSLIFFEVAAETHLSNTKPDFVGYSQGVIPKDVHRIISLTVDHVFSPLQASFDVKAISASNYLEKVIPLVETYTAEVYDDCNSSIQIFGNQSLKSSSSYLLLSQSLKQATSHLCPGNENPSIDLPFTTSVAGLHAICLHFGFEFAYEHILTDKFWGVLPYLCSAGAYGDGLRVVELLGVVVSLWHKQMDRSNFSETHAACKYLISELCKLVDALPLRLTHDVAASLALCLKHIVPTDTNWSNKEELTSHLIETLSVCTSSGKENVK